MRSLPKTHLYLSSWLGNGKEGKCTLRGKNIRRLQKHAESKSTATKHWCVLPDTLRHIPAVEIISVVVVVVLIATEKIKEIVVLFVRNGVTCVSVCVRGCQYGHATKDQQLLVKIKGGGMHVRQQPFTRCVSSPGTLCLPLSLWCTSRKRHWSYDLRLCFNCRRAWRQSTEISDMSEIHPTALKQFLVRKWFKPYSVSLTWAWASFFSNLKLSPLS